MYSSPAQVAVGLVHRPDEVGETADREHHGRLRLAPAPPLGHILGVRRVVVVDATRKGLELPEILRLQIPQVAVDHRVVIPDAPAQVELHALLAHRGGVLTDAHE